MTVDIAPAPSTDAELLQALAERRPGAFEALVAAYQDRLYSLAWRLTTNREDAEEAVQDALVKAHRALFNAYSPTRVRELTLRAWLSTVTLNAARNVRRARRPVRSLDAPRPDGRAAPEPVSTAPGPPLLAESHELGLAVEAALAELSARYRAAVVLRLVEGFSYDEAAGMLGRPVGTVKSDVHRALRQLRMRLGALLEEEGCTNSVGAQFIAPAAPDTRAQ